MTENKQPPIERYKAGYYSSEDIETLIRCCWNNARMRVQGGAYADNPQPYLWSWDYNWAKEYFKAHQPQADRGSDAEAAAESEDLEIYNSYVYWDCRDILQELVDLKEMKQYPEHKEEYERRKPLAWEIAKKVLAATEKPEENKVKEDTPIEAIEFAEWTRRNGWDICVDDRNWLHFEEQHLVTGEELYQIFKTQTHE